MRQGQNRRMRGRNRRGGPNPLQRSYESNGPDVKVRGTAQHIAEKYVQLARDAQASGDPVMAENYFQHAEHYYRILLAAQEQMTQQYGHQFQPQRPFGEDGDDLDEDGDDDGAPFPQGAPQPEMRGGPQGQMGRGEDEQPQNGNGRDGYQRDQQRDGNRNRFDRNNRRFDRQDRNQSGGRDGEERQGRNWQDRNGPRQGGEQGGREGGQPRQEPRFSDEPRPQASIEGRQPRPAIEADRDEPDAPGLPAFVTAPRRQTIEIPAEPEAAAAEPAEAAPPPRRRGRPPGAKNKAASEEPAE